MSDLRTCPQCGAESPDGSSEASCPACLMRIGLASAVAAPPSGGSDAPTQDLSRRAEALTPEELAPRFPHLEIVRLLGRGGMGAVYLARQKSLDRTVALKIVHSAAAEDPAFAERFAREAKALARLNHPNIVTVHDFGQTDGLYWFVMEYVEGADARQLLRAGTLSPQQALHIVPSICDALEYAHQEGIVHRDVKPENVLIDAKGRVKIADFGLAKLVSRKPEEVTLTAAHTAMGTPHYMAPEQLLHPQDVDHRADIYALGVTFYEMLTGELPLGRFAPPSRRVRIDVRLDEVVLKALEREPDRRYQHASEIKTDIESIARDVATETSTPAVATRLGGTPSRLLAIALALIFGGALILAGAAALIAAILVSNPDMRGALVGAGGGTLLGGIGTILGTWNNYRRMRGAADLMTVDRWTRLDAAFLLAAVLGFATMAVAGVYWTSLGPGMRIATMTVGGLVALHGVAFALWRWAERRSLRRKGHAIELDPRLVLIAVGMVLSALAMASGVAMGLIALTLQPGGPAALGGWLGATFGCVGGGAGGLFGCWNSYRHMEGAPDVWASGDVTWLDWTIGILGLFAVVMLGLGLFGPEAWHRDLRWSVGLFGGILLFQALLFGVIRGLTIRARRMDLRAARPEK